MPKTPLLKSPELELFTPITPLPWADTLSQHAIREAGSGVLITRHTDPAGAEAVAPNAVCGASGSGKGLAAHANPLPTRSKDASTVGACTLSEHTVREAGSRSGF